VSFVVKALIWACRVRHHLTISHDFLAAEQLGVAPALAAVLDALQAAEPVDGPQAPAEACTYCVPAAAAEPACSFAAADYAAVLSESEAAHLHCSNALPVQA